MPAAKVNLSGMLEGKVAGKSLDGVNGAESPSERERGHIMRCSVYPETDGVPEFGRDLTCPVLIRYVELCKEYFWWCNLTHRKQVSQLGQGGGLEGDRLNQGGIQCPMSAPLPALLLFANARKVARSSLKVAASHARG